MKAAARQGSVQGQSSRCHRNPGHLGTCSSPMESAQDEPGSGRFRVSDQCAEGSGCELASPARAGRLTPHLVDQSQCRSQHNVTPRMALDPCGAG